MKKFRDIFLLFVLSLAPTALLAQQTEREKGIALYQEGNYREAVKTLNGAVKADPNDAEALTYLSLSLIQTQKLGTAEKTLGKALALDANQPRARKALAFVLLLRGKTEDALRQAQTLKEMGAADAETYYILGAANLRLGNAEAALGNAEAAIALHPRLANAYLLKAQSLMSGRTQPSDFAQRAAKYGSAAESIGKFIALSSDLPNVDFWREQEKTLKVFADYYAEKGKNPKITENELVTPLKILSKPRAGFTNLARQNRVSGTVVLLVAFGESGKIENVLILRSLGYGLDEQAVEAARGIKFDPEKRDGKPVTSVKTVEYGFWTY